MLNREKNTPLREERKWQDTSIFNVEVLFFVSLFKLFKLGIKFSKKLPYSKESSIVSPKKVSEKTGSYQNNTH